MDLPALCACGGENSTNGIHLAVFSEDKAFSCHFMAPTCPPASYPIGVLVVLATAVKRLAKLVGNSVSY